MVLGLSSNIESRVSQRTPWKQFHGVFDFWCIIIVKYGGCYDNAKRNYEVGKLYEEYGKRNLIPFEYISSVKSYDDTTLFCPAGMQKYKGYFKDNSIKNITVCNIQSCIRLVDLDLIGDGTHYLYFNMMGMFSFRDWDIERTIDFWTCFIESKLGLKIDYTTVHSDRYYWSKYHNSKTIIDDNCKWSDGDIGGYCTEFYINGVEIGNIVNPLETCIDVGFGLERLENIFRNISPKSNIELLQESIIKIIDCGYFPSGKHQGYILRKLLRKLHKLGGSIEHKFFHDEVIRQSKMLEKYNRLYNKNLDKSKEWWYDTHGIDVEEIKSP